MLKFYFLIFSLFFINTRISSKNHLIDVVICCHEKDLRTLDLAIEGIKKFGTNINRVIIISKKRLTNKAEWFNEDSFPFSKYDVALAIFNNNKEKALEFSKSTRIGWIYKQLLNWYSPFVIPNISSNVLMLDADTIFLNKVEFLDSNGNILYNVGREYHKPYFEHAKKLIAGKNQIVRVYPKISGISHHLLFQRDIVEDLFKQITKTHNMEPWRAICKCLDHKHLNHSSMAEGEIYFNFAVKNTNRIKIRYLKWKDMKFNLEKIKETKAQGYHYVSCHSWMDKLKKVNNHYE